MNITITGNLGSGKTSVCKELKKSGFEIISAGDIFREIATEKGMTVIELNEAAKKDRSIDDMLDNRSTELGKKMDHTVFDSRLAWHFVEHSFKVFLLVDVQEAARRVFAGDNRGAEAYQDMEGAKAGLASRAKLEQERFRELYGIDYYDAGNYDLVIESSCASPEQVAQEIKRNFELYQAEPFFTKIELNLKSLYPTMHFEEMDEAILAGCFREEAEKNKALCANGSFGLVEKNGYYYIADGYRKAGPASLYQAEPDPYYRAFAAIKARKVFAEIKDIQMGQAVENVGLLMESDIEGFEQAGGFRYPANPVRIPKKPGYMADFSRVFHA